MDEIDRSDRNLESQQGQEFTRREFLKLLLAFLGGLGAGGATTGLVAEVLQEDNPIEQKYKPSDIERFFSAILEAKIDSGANEDLIKSIFEKARSLFLEKSSKIFLAKQHIMIHNLVVDGVGERQRLWEFLFG